MYMHTCVFGRMYVHDVALIVSPELEQVEYATVCFRCLGARHARRMNPMHTWYVEVLYFGTSEHARPRALNPPRCRAQLPVQRIVGLHQARAFTDGQCVLRSQNPLLVAPPCLQKTASR